MEQTTTPAAGNGPQAAQSAAADNQGQAGHGHQGAHGKLLPLTLGALGIVYGDIGTSPLYSIKECFHGLHAIPVTHDNVMGVLSLIFWSLTAMVSIKYVFFIMRADNKGEGGIFALLALLSGRKDDQGGKGWLAGAVFVLAIFGAALLYGDGIITPAISVLSAVEGLEVATEAAKPVVIPITCLVLVGLFLIQRHGTATIGKVFGPIMCVWFATLMGLGLLAIARMPGVLAALNPAYAVRFFDVNGFHGIVVLGSVVLCITGGEALFADMGHFGLPPIRLSWYTLVFPSLVVNYFGQGALLLMHPEEAANPFYGLVPQGMLFPMVGLATMATVIASQAMISGVFSLTQQAIQLGCLPRMRIQHTSSETKGQIYVPTVNAFLMVACLGLVFAFKESSRLAAAYGIAVTATMAITTILYFLILRRNWRWPLWMAAPLVGFFLFFDVSYLGANLLKFWDGGWFTISVALAIAVAMKTWREGRRILAEKYRVARMPIENFLCSVESKRPQRLDGAAVFMSVSEKGTPVALLHHYKHIRALHERVVILTLLAADEPFVPPHERLAVADLGQGFSRAVARYGFMETPSVPEVMRLAREQGLVMDMPRTTFFLGRETLITTGSTPMAKWRKELFVFMSRNASNATNFFGIPPGRVVELGAQIAL